ncbi:TPA: hypothetical protein VKX02_001465 [Streptococcus pyogenes]|nr:hypothetical protein [Streptococcus pyogenes]HER5376031.1 hypothetical protein [Streptococcus pyogenes]
MKNRIYTYISKISKVFEFINYLISLLVFLGLLIVFIFRISVTKSLYLMSGLLHINNYHGEVIPIEFVFFACVLAIVILFCIANIFKKVSIIALNIGERTCFVDTNFKYLVDIIKNLILIIIIRIFGEAIFIYIQNGTIKELLNIHFKDYIFNFILIIMALFAYLILKKRKNM